MKDQYDDGRYDGAVTESPGGWRTPDSQRPEWPFDRYYPDGILAPPPRLAHTSIGYLPITARRGGIKYPTQKENTVTTPRDPEAELKVLNELRDELNARAAKLRKEIRDRVPEPGPESDAFAIDVKFSTRGKPYRFLLLRTPGGWYTTGRAPENSFFPTWAALVAWLEGPDVAWHSALISLSMHQIVAWNPAP